MNRRLSMQALAYPIENLVYLVVKYLLLILFIFIFSCQQPTDQQTKVSKKNVSKGIPTGSDIIRNQQLYREDSIYSALLLSKALKYAERHINSSGYVKALADSTVEMRFGRLFADTNKYLIVERTKHHPTTNVDLFIRVGNEFKLINNINTDLLSLDYLGYKVRDVNGDGKKDFMVYIYPSSGCCRRLVYWVYLYKQKADFSAKYEFLNPTFSPHEKFIRGVDYGHPGEVPLYKYKWNGLKVDTVEFIYRADTLGKKFYRLTKRSWKYKDLPKQTLNRLPREYRKIESIEWFLMNY